MVDMMTFPDTVEEFMEQYKITDTEQIYTNGAELVPIFRMKQWFDHKPERKTGKWVDNIYCSECGWVHTTEPGFIGSVEGFNFCPNCGAYMREGNP